MRICIHRPIFLITTLLVSTALFAQEKLYPAKRNDLWGFINQAGKFVVQPRFIHHEDNSSGAPFYMVSKGSTEGRFHLHVFDSLGREVKVFSDTLGFNYYSQYTVAGTSTGIRQFAILNGFETAPALRQRNYYHSAGESSDPDSVVHNFTRIEGIPYDRVWFKLKLNRRAYAYIHYVSKDLILLNSGGTTLAYYESYRSGCVIREGWQYGPGYPYPVTGGVWGVLNSRGDTIIPFTISDVRNLEFGGAPLFQSTIYDAPAVYIVKSNKTWDHLDRSTPATQIDIYSKTGNLLGSERGDTFYTQKRYFGNNYLLQVRGNRAERFYLIDNQGKLLGVYDGFREYSQGLSLVLKEGYWHAVDSSNTLVYEKLAPSGKNIYKVNEDYFATATSDSTIQLENFKSREKREIKGKYVHWISGDYLWIQVSQADSLFAIQTPDGKEICRMKAKVEFRDAGNTGMLALNNRPEMPVVVQTGEHNLKPISTAYLFGEKVAVINGASILDSSLQLVPFNNTIIWSSVSGLSFWSATYPNYYFDYHGRAVAAVSSAYDMKITARGTATLVLGGRYRDHLFFWFPDVEKLIKLGKGWTYRDHVDYGGVLRIDYTRVEDGRYIDGSVYLSSSGKVIYSTSKVRVDKISPTHLKKWLDE